jgi:hypothetical protein
MLSRIFLKYTNLEWSTLNREALSTEKNLKIIITLNMEKFYFKILKLKKITQLLSIKNLLLTKKKEEGNYVTNYLSR